jgi:hypothetical protein
MSAPEAAVEDANPPVGEGSKGLLMGVPCGQAVVAVAPSAWGA